jgi:hypothetical protein
VIVTLLTVLVLAGLVCLVGVGVVVVPFVLALDMAERRQFSTARAGAACLLLAGGCLLLSYVAVKDHHGAYLVPAVLLGWAGPALLALLSPSQRGLGGVQGAHER